MWRRQECSRRWLPSRDEQEGGGDDGVACLDVRRLGWAGRTCVDVCTGIAVEVGRSSVPEWRDCDERQDAERRKSYREVPALGRSDVGQADPRNPQDADPADALRGHRSRVLLLVRITAQHEPAVIIQGVTQPAVGW